MENKNSHIAIFLGILCAALVVCIANKKDTYQEQLNQRLKKYEQYRESQPSAKPSISFEIGYSSYKPYCVNRHLCYASDRNYDFSFSYGTPRYYPKPVVVTQEYIQPWGIYYYF